MPIYEYSCKQCQTISEIMQRFDEKTPKICPNCNCEGSLKKVVSHTAFHLKGGGWYKDLYASKKPEASKVEDKSKKSCENQTSEKTTSTPKKATKKE